MGSASRLTLADIFNLFDQQTVVKYDTWTTLTFGGPANPNFGQPTSEIVARPQIQAPGRFASARDSSSRILLSPPCGKTSARLPACHPASRVLRFL